jgi:hypothetical protein
MGRHIVFTCPQTGMNVQHWLADGPDDARDNHSPVVCQACTKLHFIHNATGKLLGQDDKIGSRRLPKQPFNPRETFRKMWY